MNGIKILSVFGLVAAMSAGVQAAATQTVIFKGEVADLVPVKTNLTVNEARELSYLSQRKEFVETLPTTNAQLDYSHEFMTHESEYAGIEILVTNL